MPPRRISMRNREFLLTVYKRACIFPPDILEERCDQTQIRPFAADARPVGVLNGGTLCFANYFIACARACGGGRSKARWNANCAFIWKWRRRRTFAVG